MKYILFVFLAGGGRLHAGGAFDPFGETKVKQETPSPMGPRGAPEDPNSVKIGPRLAKCPEMLKPLEKAILRFLVGTYQKPHEMTMAWESPGGGGDFPYNRLCTWTGTEWSVEAFSKVDLSRGTADEDFTNGVYAKMLCVMRDLCDPKRHLVSSLSAFSLHTHGSYAECSLGDVIYGKVWR